MAGLLLRQGADVNAADAAGRTALHRAAWRGQVAVVKLLLQAGADPHLRNRDGQTPRHEAEANGHTAVADLLRGAQGTEATAEMLMTEPPARKSLALTKVRIHPRQTGGARPSPSRRS